MYFSDFYNAAIRKLSEEQLEDQSREEGLDYADDYEAHLLPLCYALENLPYIDNSNGFPLSKFLRNADGITKRASEQANKRDTSRLAMRILKKRYDAKSNKRDTSRLAMRILRKRSGQGASRLAMRILKKRGSNSARIAMRVLKKRENEPHPISRMARITRSAPSNSAALLRHYLASYFPNSYYGSFVDSRIANAITDDEANEEKRTEKENVEDTEEDTALNSE